MSKSFGDARDEITGGSWLDAAARASLSAAEAKFAGPVAPDQETRGDADAQYDSLPPVQHLVMEVLAARARLGERYWTFPTRLRPALSALEARGWIWVRAAPTPHLQAWLTDPGRSVALWDGYTSAADRDRAKLANVRKLALSLGDRSNEPLDPALPPGDAGRYSDRRLMEPLRRLLLEILDRP